MTAAKFQKDHFVCGKCGADLRSSNVIPGTNVVIEGNRETCDKCHTVNSINYRT